MRISFLILLLLSPIINFSQSAIIELPYNNSENIVWNGGEKEYFSENWKTPVVTNVSVPTLMVFEPEKSISTGTAVIIAPGGGLYAHSIESEGLKVAQWLNEKGITAFVLKYRLMPTAEDGVKEFGDQLKSGFPDTLSTVYNYAIADGLNAVKHVRKHAATYGIDTNKIGFMGFSAGGAITMGVAYNYDKTSKPNFLVPVYAWTDIFDVEVPKDNAPPLFAVCASNDGLGLAPGTIEIYNSWYNAKKSVSMVMYAKGNHGFGMRTKNLPSDTWIDRFYEWALSQKLVTVI
ncbi:hypothetical protein KH5_18930 [Urechidicola sp. KH5]